MYGQIFMSLWNRTDILKQCNLIPTGLGKSCENVLNSTVIAGAGSHSATAPPPYGDKVPTAPPIEPSTGLYPLITETRITRNATGTQEATTMQVYSHVPFNPVDLAAFKAQAGEFSTNPSRFISVFEGCLVSHKPDWDDCQVLLRTLLSEVERNQVLAKARAEAERRHEQDPATYKEAKDQVPFTDPQWNPNKPEGMGPLTNYKELLLFGLRHSAVRHNNWAKPYEIVQEPKESPVAFLQRIRDAIRQHTTANPESPEIEAVIKGIFTSRAAPDIKRKLQKKEDLMGMTMAQILETANKAYSLRDVEKEKRQVCEGFSATPLGRTCSFPTAW
ncbi:uncharacterized protein LOC115649367 [Gopherus evgoodei]|uniref:uncharacterized protein LOC115649367 n=1 Tax=Gopherus evgoodei TaxID=1825980 RepID=UPI0011D0244B|nr:uncharacterized protein LOC115649367 [Gopherus evgoodei]